MKNNSLLREFIEYLKWKKRKIEEAEGNKACLVNMFADPQLLEDTIKACNDNPDLVAELWTRDGARLKLHTYDRNGNSRRINWDEP